MAWVEAKEISCAILQDISETYFLLLQDSISLFVRINNIVVAGYVIYLRMIWGVTLFYLQLRVVLSRKEKMRRRTS